MLDTRSTVQVLHILVTMEYSCNSITNYVLMKLPVSHCFDPLKIYKANSIKIMYWCSF